jgi:hypothetical protein
MNCRRAPWVSPILGRCIITALKGILKIGVHDTGNSLSVLPPFSLFQSPLKRRGPLQLTIAR